MADRITGTVRAEEIPADFAARLTHRPALGTRYRVIFEEIEETDEEKRAALRAAIQRGRDEVAAGQVVDGETMFAELRAELFPDTVNK